MIASRKLVTASQDRMSGLCTALSLRDRMRQKK
jgi:hypothetical protein